MNREYEFSRRVIPAFSRVGESVFFVLAKSSGEGFAFLGLYVDTFGFFLFEDRDHRAGKDRKISGFG